MAAPVVIGLALFYTISHTIRSPLPSPRERFRLALVREARGVRDPWALAHALLAFGPDLVLNDGRPVAEVLASDHLRRAPDGSVRFELRGTPAEIGEVHPHLVLKTLRDAGVQPTLARELDETARLTFVAPTTFEEWNDVAWFLEALARNGATPEAMLGSSPGLTVQALAEGALARVEEADRLVEEALARQPFVRRPGDGPPETSGVWAYTCGGQHLLQGVIVAEGAGLLPPGARERLQARLRVFVRRVVAEAGFRDDERQRALAAGLDPRRVTCEWALTLLKLHGHALETYARARDAGLLVDDVTQGAAESHRALRDLFREVCDVADPGALLVTLRKRDIGIWRLWFGDGCHAFRGLGLWSP